MARRTRTIDATAAEIQQVLERDYAHLEWRVLVSPALHSTAAPEHQLHVHARTRDFRYRCRVSRPWHVVQATSSLRTLVAELAGEAEQLLAAQSAPPQEQCDERRSCAGCCHLLPGTCWLRARSAPAAHLSWCWRSTASATCGRRARWSVACYTAPSRADQEWIRSRCWAARLPTTT